jgi:hypothetical protein
MKNIIAGIAVALLLCSTVPRAQNAPAVTQGAPTSPPPSAPAAETAAADTGLNDLAAMTFSCPKAALNAAAREAAKVRTQGAYQFAFFRIVSDSHHASYEVRFKSNYAGEKELKYCVAIYCQQGWDPATTKTSVTLMSNARQPAAAADHGAHCGGTPASEGQPSKR